MEALCSMAGLTGLRDLEDAGLRRLEQCPRIQAVALERARHPLARVADRQLLVYVDDERATGARLAEHVGRTEQRRPAGVDANELPIALADHEPFTDVVVQGQPGVDAPYK